jgi:L-2-hydroxyglutarate oxidase
MEDLFRRAKENGLSEIKRLQADELTQYEPHVKGIAGMYLPYTGITDYKLVALKMQELFENKFGGEVILNEEVKAVRKIKDEIILATGNNEFKTKIMVNTAGLFSDRVAAISGMHPDVRVIPFRGEYYTLVKEKEYLVKNLIYPIPDPKFPFLGVHFTRMVGGGIEAGPNAVFAFKREAYRKNNFSFRDTWESFSWPGFQKLMVRYAGMGLGEFYRSYNKAAFTKALQRLIPEIRQEDLVRGITGVRAQACDKKGNLIDDFLFAEEERIINVLNSPSPAATASLSIGKAIAGKALMKLE